MTDLTELICIVDRSGSMGAIRDDAIGGFNTFLKDQQEAPGDAQLSLVLFDHEYDIVHERVPLPDVDPLTTDTFVPRGSTALLDAIGATIDRVGGRISETPAPDRPGHVIVAILTDGMENASRRYSHRRIRHMIDRQQSRYDWDFIYLGANQDAISVAQEIAIPQHRARAFEASREGVRDGYARYSSLVMDARVERRGRR